MEPMSSSRRGSRWLAAALTWTSCAGLAHAAEPVPATLTYPELAGPELTLDALLEHAHAHAPRVALDRADDARIRAAREAAGRVLPDNPELSLGVGPRIEDGAVGVDFEVGLSQRFEVAGERAARRRVAGAIRRGIEAELRDRHWDLHTTVHALFYRALVARERVALAAQVVAFQEEIARIVGKQRAAGEVSQLDERVALAESANARQALSAAVQVELGLRHELALVTGWPADAPPRPRGALTPVTHLPPLSELSARAEASRPDLAVLDAAIAEARARVAAADRDRTPEPTLGLSWTRESSPVGGEGAHVVIATIGLPLPLVVENDPARAEARAALEVALAERRRAGAEVAAAVTRAYRAAELSTRRLATFGNEVLPRFDENLAALRRAFELGEIDIFGLASGRERFLEARRDALSAQESYFDALAELEHAVGIDILDAAGGEHR